MLTPQTLSVMEVPMAVLASALSKGHLSSLGLTAKYLPRIAKCDRRIIQPNAIPIINQDAFDASQQSDQRRASGDFLVLLDGIPYTIKDSNKIQRMTVEDAFTVQKLREAGAVFLGRTSFACFQQRLGGVHPFQRVVVHQRTVSNMGLTPPQLKVDATSSATDGEKIVNISGLVNEDEVSEIHVYVDGEESEGIEIVGGKWEAKSKVREVRRTHPNEKSVPEFDTSFVVTLVEGHKGRSSANMMFV
jgi:hypothetical protein